MELPLNDLSAIVVENTLEPGETEKVVSLLKKNGVAEENIQLLKESDTLKGNHKTIIVSRSVDFPQYNYTGSVNYTVVTPEWVEVVDKQGRTVPERSYSPDPRSYFKNVFITCSGIGAGDRESLYGGVLAMGGLFSETLSTFTTHLVALNDTGKRCVSAKQYNIKIVLPHWIDNCLKLGRRLDDGPYLFPNPKYLEHSRDEDEIINQSAVRETQLEFQSTYNSPDDAPAKTGSLFKGKKVYLCEDLDLQISQQAIEDIIRIQQGEVTSNVEEADVYIGRFRDGKPYKRASQRQIAVGSLAWLYWMLAHDKWSSPVVKLLHYPVPRHGIPEFENFEICISNFIGEARVYLERLIEATGAKYTRTLRKGVTTHLITSLPRGLKYEAARQWNIDTVNPLWLEESYAMYECMSVANKRYSHMPERIDLTEILNKTCLNRAVLCKFYEDTPSAEEGTYTPKTSIARKRFGSRNRLGTDESESGTATPTRAGKQSTPEVSSSIGENREATPRLGSARSAKTKGLELTHNMSVKESEYLKQYSKHKKKHELPSLEGESQWGPDSQPPEPKRPKIEADDEEKENINSDVEIVKLVTTGLDSKQNKQLKQQELQDLGIFVTDDANEATYLVATRVMRTAKFLQAMSRIEHFVLPEYFDECVKEGQRIEPIPEKFLLQSKARELGKALARRKQVPSTLFEGYVFNMASELGAGTYKTYQEIVSVHGGSCKKITGNGARTKFDGYTDPKTNKMVKILIIGSPTSSPALVQNFKKNCEEDIHHIYTTDFLIDSILGHDVKLKSKYEVL
ncbi:hypothetical protein TRVA0_068S00254 [Trichomonascus vanleenenianus]|uniref:Rtt107p n=1 Tax=Trichomonascus vanleenenianus TaxID=2268995 RepID=UPI003ECACA45